MAEPSSCVKLWTPNNVCGDSLVAPGRCFGKAISKHFKNPYNGVCDTVARIIALVILIPLFIAVLPLTLTGLSIKLMANSCCKKPIPFTPQTTPPVTPPATPPASSGKGPSAPFGAPYTSYPFGSPPTQPTNEPDKKMAVEDDDTEPFKPDLSHPLSVSAVKGMLDQHNKVFLGPHGQPLINETGKNKVTDLIMASYQHGLPLYVKAGDHSSNGLFKEDLQTIFLYANKKSPQIQAKILKRLADCFLDCQAVQARMIEDIAKEIRGSNTFDARIVRMWNQFKDRKLEQFILQHHTDALNAGSATPQKQMPHLKSGYLVAFGNMFKMDGLAAANADQFKATELFGSGSQFNNLLVTSYGEFLQEVAQEINHDSAAASVTDKVIKKGNKTSYNKFFKWFSEKGFMDYEFGMYHPDKNYKGLAEPSKEQKDAVAAVYISVDEVAVMLQQIVLPGKTF